MVRFGNMNRLWIDGKSKKLTQVMAWALDDQVGEEWATSEINEANMRAFFILGADFGNMSATCQHFCTNIPLVANTISGCLCSNCFGKCWQTWNTHNRLSTTSPWPWCCHAPLFVDNNEMDNYIINYNYLYRKLSYASAGVGFELELPHVRVVCMTIVKHYPDHVIKMYSDHMIRICTVSTWYAVTMNSQGSFW